MMKRMIAALALLAVLAACLPARCEETPLRVGALKGPTGMGLVKLMADDQQEGRYAFTLAASPDLLVPALSRGELDAACLPANLAAILCEKTQGAIRVVNINTLGVLYILERGSGIQSLADLRGRVLYASGKSSTPEYVLAHLLQQAGVEDVRVEWKAEHAEALAALLSDPQGAALLPQPFVTVAQSKAEGLRVALDLNQQWRALGQGELVTGVTVARAAFISQQPQRLARFLEESQASVAYVNSHAPEAAALMDAFQILPAPVAEQALPYCNITFIQGEEMKRLLTPFYQVLFQHNPDTVGGRLPDDAFYYIP